MKTNFLTKMKRISIYSLFSLMLFSSCDSILEEKPMTQIEPEFFFRDTADALAALTAVYAQLKSDNGYYRQIFLSNLFAASDQGASSFQHGDFRNGTLTSTDANLPNTWIEIYRGIKDANNVIANVPNIPNMDEPLRARILGEARFLRALNYFNLVRCFGEVPLRTQPALPGEPGLPKSPIKDIYDVIINDFTYATQNCWAFNETRNGVNNNIGRVTKAAAHAMLAKVYTQIASSKRTAMTGVQGNNRYLDLPGTPESYYTLAKEQCDLTIAQPGYQLVTNLQDWKRIFDATNGNNAECLFDIQGSSLAEQGTAVSNLFCPQNAGLSAGGWGGTNRMQPGFINNNLNKNDIRFQNSIIRNYQDATQTYTLGPNSTGYLRTITATGASNGTLSVVWTAKYIDQNATTEYTSQQNWHVIRLADVYLMRAEALAEINQNPALAAPDINSLRTRVGMTNFSATGLTMTAFRTALLRERAVELSAEGQRFFDITRMGVYDEMCRASFGNTVGARQAQDYTWPIPLIETAANGNL
jgi:starch-binding outer membrane protein, SusD/RagB family